MATCEETGCIVEFGVLNHRYICCVCSKEFCDDHACSSAYLMQFGGLHYPDIEKVLNENGYICQACFAKAGPGLQAHAKGLFRRTCSHPECDVSLKNIFNRKFSCLSCGQWYCRSHCKLGKNEVSNAWLHEHTHFPLAEMVCTLCHEQKSAKFLAPHYPEHPKSQSLKLLAGSEKGPRTAILVHGILSDFKALSGLANALVSRGGFDSVWAFDDIAYHGRVNEAKALSVADIPIGFDGALKALISSIGAKALQVINLPAYIVEGAARNLFLNLDFLGQTDVTVIGHSLGGVVSRCMVETYDVSPFLRSVVTLASPHYLWLLAQRSNLQYWKGLPSPDVKYLAVLGKGDWVSREMYSNYTADDRLYGNLTKVLIKGDHTSIHGQPFGTYVPELIKGFLDEFHGFYIQVQGGKPYLRYAPLHGNSGEQVVSFPQGRWLEFTPSSS